MLDTQLKIRISEELKQQLENKARVEGRTVSNLVRHLLTRAVESNGNSAPMVGTGNDGAK